MRSSTTSTARATDPYAAVDALLADGACALITRDGAGRGRGWPVPVDGQVEVVARQARRVIGGRSPAM